MRKGLLLGPFVAFLLTSNICFAQPGPALLPPVQSSAAPSLDGPRPLAELFSPTDTPFDVHVWGSAEYLLWRFSNSPFPNTLVSAGGFTPPPPPPAPPHHPLGEPDPILFGGHGYSPGLQSGFRVTLGAWLDNSNTCGIEASGFYMLPRSTANFSAGASSPNQVLAIPFVNATPGGGAGSVFPGVIGANSTGQSAFLISGGDSKLTGNPMIGSIAINSSSSLWGAEANGVVNLYRARRVEIDLLGGFRYADLAEDLYINTVTNDPAVGTPAAFADHFGTRNQFYGGQLGLKGEWSNGVFFMNAKAQVALGANEETVRIDGAFADLAPVFLKTPGAGVGGLFAQRSNIGQYSRGRFMVLPETQMQVGLYLCSNVRIFAGYDFMYMSSVVRPGDQIDPNINLNLVGGHSPGAVAGPASPGVPFQSSTFWVQGATFGLEIRY